MMMSFSIFSPLTISISPHDDTAFMVTLDVCNASGGALSVNNESPVIQESHYRPVIPAFIEYVNILHPEHVHLLLTSREERPPES